MTERPLSRVEHELLRILAVAHRRCDERNIQRPCVAQTETDWHVFRAVKANNKQGEAA